MFRAGPPDAPDTYRDGTLFMSDESGPQRRPDGHKESQMTPMGSPEPPTGPRLEPGTGIAGRRGAPGRR
jgi:hypothetical protein